MECLIASLIFLVNALITFKKTKILHLSVIFSVMWGVACLFCWLVQYDYVFTYDKEYYDFKSLDTYILLFSIISVGAFKLAHVKSRKHNNIKIDADSLYNLLNHYKFIMYINCALGLARIAAMFYTFGFDSLSDYRMAVVFSDFTGGIGLIIRLSNYSLLLANLYIACLGLYHGFTSINKKSLVLNFLLFSPVQMSTGGRLFILYFIIYYFGSLFIGRGVGINGKLTIRRIFSHQEIRLVGVIICVLLSLVSILGIMKSEEGYDQYNKESSFAKLLYLTDGMQVSEYAFETMAVNNLNMGYGSNSFGNNGTNWRNFVAIKQGTRFAPMVNCIIPSLFFDFGYYGSLFFWFFFAFLIEKIGLYCLKDMNLMRFFAFIILAKIMYETPIFNAFTENYPFIELLFILVIFYKPLLKKYIHQ